jgi:hypothetical protein
MQFLPHLKTLLSSFIKSLFFIGACFVTASFKILSNCGGGFPSNPVLLPSIPLNLRK